MQQQNFKRSKEKEAKEGEQDEEDAAAPKRKAKAKAKAKGKSRAKKQPAAKAKSSPNKKKGRGKRATEAIPAPSTPVSRKVKVPDESRSKRKLVDGEVGGVSKWAKKTFARRYRPATESGGNLWDALMTAFVGIVSVQLSAPSTMEVG